MATHTNQNAGALLVKVRGILEQACEQDGQGRNLQEIDRRKAYRVGINRALMEIGGYEPPRRGRPPKKPTDQEG